MVIGGIGNVPGHVRQRVYEADTFLRPGAVIAIQDACLRKGNGRENGSVHQDSRMGRRPWSLRPAPISA